MKLSFRQDLQIATIRSESQWNKFKVHTLLQNIEKKQPSFAAYLSAKYSKTSDSILNVANDVISNNIDISEDLEKSLSGYVYQSVGEMADLFVCVEDVPMYTIMRFFYSNPVISGQERSTRYQNFNNPEFVRIPSEICTNIDVRKSFDRIMLKEIRDYKELLRPTREALSKYFQINTNSTQEVSALRFRSFDVARYLLPFGLSTSSAFLMSAKNWSSAISFLSASDSVVDNELSSLLLNLIGESDLDTRGYMREVDTLIRNVDANCSRKNSTNEILNYLRKDMSKEQTKNIPTGECDSVNVSYSPDCTEALISHYESLINPLCSAKEYEFSINDQESISEILFENHDNYSTIGNIGQSGAVKISGFATLGTLKDLNRHRCLERFIPLLHDEIDMSKELDRENYQCFYLCDYLFLNGFSKLKKEYEKRLEETYKMIREWRSSASGSLSSDVIDEFTKYLLPHAHATRYIMYGSFDDLQYVINLRVRNGGHIAYRKLIYEWLRKLNLKDSIWKSLLRDTIAPNANNKEQFVDRS